MRNIAVIVACAALGLAGCGQSPAQKQAEQMKQAADQMQKGADQLEKGSNQLEKNSDQLAKGAENFAAGLAGMARGLTGMGGDPNQKPVDPVGFRELQSVMGDMSGWEKGKPTGERMTSPVNYSKAEVSYTKGNSRIRAEISDSAFNQLLLAPMSMFLTSGYEKETDHGYEKSAKVGDYPALEKWDSNDKSGELTIVVNKRFIVQLDGRNIDDPKALRTAAAAIDMSKLTSLK